jgi:ABC-type transporter Mla MlaB component
MRTARRPQQLFRPSDSRYLPAIRGRNWNRRNYKRPSTQLSRNSHLGRREPISFTSRDFEAGAKSARRCKFQTGTCGLSCTGLENISGSLFRNGDSLTSSEASEREMQSEKASKPTARFAGRSFAIATSYPLWNSMLRISRIGSSPGDVILRLEGSLIGPWVTELRKCCVAVCKDGHQLSLDLTEVSFADSKGLALLRTLRNSNVGLAGCSSLLAEELNRG